MRILAISVVIFTTIVACKSNQGYTNPNEENQQRGGNRRSGGQPTAEQLIQQMDGNNDNKLSKQEVKGPLADNFSTVDTNSDGFLSKEELENAPKPQRRRQQGRGGMMR